MNNQAIETTFPKVISIFGVTVRGTAETPDVNLIHAANILAQYLDNDEDGVPDNQLVVDKLASENATLLVTRDQAQTEQIFDLVPPGSFQDLNAAEMNLNSQSGGPFDGSLEEVLHLVTVHGYAKAYPETFGEFPRSAIADAMDLARGGQFQTIPGRYPEDAWYTYYDDTCDYRCQVSEYTYWTLTSLLGGQNSPRRLDEIGDEWRLNTPTLLKKGDPAVYQILTDPQYRLPTILPDGSYTVVDIQVGCSLYSGTALVCDSASRSSAGEKVPNSIENTAARSLSPEGKRTENDENLDIYVSIVGALAVVLCLIGYHFVKRLQISRSKKS